MKICYTFVKGLIIKPINNFQINNIMSLLTVNFGIPEFNSLGEKELNQKEFPFGTFTTKEELFKLLLDTLPKRIKNNWKSLEFTFKGKFTTERVLVCKHWLIETDFDFENSHEILEIE